ncbi:MAG: hypothetical protein LBV79_00235, partial [Candidatus Adiutrix sp.]|nr:hypothetical protein [Candidatus Adiutrix sp.]
QAGISQPAAFARLGLIVIKFKAVQSKCEVVHDCRPEIVLWQPDDRTVIGRRCLRGGYSAQMRCIIKIIL